MSASSVKTLGIDTLLRVLRGLRNGIIYGAKVRFPHALVMTFLFRDGSFQDKLKGIAKATITHAKNLGLFALTFKLIRELLAFIRQTDDGFNTLIAGFIGGGLRFGENDPITSQINMYIMSRVIFGIANWLVREGYVQYTPTNYRLFGATIWGLVMYLFYHERGVMQKSIESSMDYIYVESDTFAPLPSSFAGVLDWVYYGHPE